MTRKIARQSEVTPLHTIDEYLWNERLGVSQLPPVDMSQQGQPNLSSVPPQPSQAPTIDYDASNGQSDMFGSGVGSEGRPLGQKEPNTTPASVPARAKAASIGAFDLARHLMDEHGMDNSLIRDHDENVKLHDQEHRDWPNSGGHKHSSKEAAVSTLYGDVEPTPTTGEKSNNGSQANRSNSPEETPNGPDASPASSAAEGEEGASALGEAAELAVVASKYRVGSVLDPKESAKDDEEGHYKYIKHRNGKWVIIQKGTGKVLSTHDTREKAISSFKAMMMSKHGG